MREAVPPAPRPREESPWAKGVSAARQAAAEALLVEGTTFFEKLDYSRALAKFQAAIGKWDHPGIRYNVAVCLVHLDQPVEALENLTQALRYGRLPLDAKQYQDALTYRRLLEGRLARLQVRCAEPGAEVVLDGKRLFVGPGDATVLLLPGEHRLVASRASYLTFSKTILAWSGKLSRIDLKLVPLADTVVRMKRRWAPWKPWLVLGAGLIVAAVGAPLMALAAQDLKAFDRKIDALCGKDGCDGAEVPTSILEIRDRGREKNMAAIGLFSVGGLIMAAGAAMLILNLPRAQKPPPLPFVEPTVVGFSVVPTLLSHGGVVSAVVLFW